MNEDRYSSKKLDNKFKNASEKIEERITNNDESEEEVQLPPPMKLISKSLRVTNENNQLQTENYETDMDKMERFVMKRLVKFDSTNQNAIEETNTTFDKLELKAKDISLNRRKYVLQELLKTENDYVKDLADVVDGYLNVINDPKSPIKKPEAFSERKQQLVFVNIESIYKFHKDTFIYALENSIRDLSRMGDLFAANEQKLLLMYVFYCQSNPISNFILNEFIGNYFEEIRKHLQFKLLLSDLLIKPMQRVTKYQLILKDLLKYSTKIRNDKESASITKAITIMEIIPKTANDMMDVTRIKGFDTRLYVLGKLLRHGSIKCVNMTYRSDKSVDKLKNFHIYIFEQLVIFCEVYKKYSGTWPAFAYKGHINMNNLNFKVQDSSDKNQPFIVQSLDPKKLPFKFYCVGLNEEEGIAWRNQFEVILEKQNSFMRAVQLPIAYQNNLRKAEEKENKEDHKLSVSG